MTPQKQLSLFVLPVLGALLLWYATATYRVGVSPDTMAFLSVAHHIEKGQGISAYYPLFSDRSQPLAAWPPLFPVVIWSGMPFGVHPLDTAWVANMIFFAGVILMSGWIVARSCRSAAAGWVTQIIFILYAHWRGFYVWALSEPLFLLLILIAVLAMLKYLESGRDRHFVVSALALGLCEITRYIGAVYIPAFAAAIFLFQEGVFRKRFMNAARFLILGGVIPMVWAVRNYVRLDFLQETPRSWEDRVFGSLIHHEGNVNSLGFNARSAVKACIVWIDDFFGGRLNDDGALGILVFVAALAAAVVAAGLLRRGITETPGQKGFRTAAALSGLLVYCYTAGLIGGLTFSSFAGETPDRYLIPTVMHLVMLCVMLVFGPGSAGVNRPQALFGVMRWFFCAVFLVWVAMSAADTARWVQKTRAEGPDDSRGARWRNAKVRNWFPTSELIQDFYRRKLYERQSLGSSF